MHQRLLASCVLALKVFLVSAQAPINGTPRIIPPTPNAAALEKFIQNPVGTYSGVPNITVPLYEIKVRDLSVPISLNYHAGGFRVSEEASWVGLGWALQAGGAITRTVRNLDDFTYFIKPYSNANADGSPFTMPDPIIGLDYAITAPFIESGTSFTGNGFNAGNTFTGAMGVMHDAQNISVNKKVILNGAAITQLNQDWEPDDFRFTAGNYSGSFAFKQDGTVHLLEQQKVKIELPSNNNPWKITTPDGFQYFYSAEEYSTVIDPDPAKGTTTTAWYMTRMVSPSGEEITLVYEKGPKIKNLATLSQKEVKQFNGTCDALGSADQSGIFAAGSSDPQYLRRINFKNGHVIFDRETTPRLDLEGALKLRRISIYDNQDKLLKFFDLQTSYFDTPDGLKKGCAPDAYTSTYQNKRLRLNAIQETGMNGVVKSATVFSYSETPLPSKSSYSLDYWGYNNGKSNSTLIPAYSGPDITGSFIIFPGADRAPDGITMQACIINKVTYPTGGSTKYTFEPHDYDNLTVEDDRYITDLQNLRIHDDNIKISDNYKTPSDPTFTITTPTPFNVHYTIRIINKSSSNSNLKSEVAVRLIDKRTNKTLVSGRPNGPDYYQAVWTFTESERSDFSKLETNGEATILLPPGTYTLEVFRPNCTPGDESCHVIFDTNASYPILAKISESSFPKRLAGGLRIKRIEEVDGQNAQLNHVWNYEYGFHKTGANGNDVIVSSGTLISRPVFKKILRYNTGNATTPLCTSLQMTSYSTSAFSAGAKGSTVGYNSVSVIQGEKGEGGKTEYGFHCLPDRPTEYPNPVSNVPTRSEDLNGYPTGQATYRWALDGYHLVSSTAQSYESPNEYRYDLPAMYRGSSWLANAGEATQVKKTYFYYYPLPVRWVRLQSTTTTNYDPADESKYVTTRTRYTYDMNHVGHMQVSRTETTRSDGATLLTTTSYPADYTAVTTGPLVAMRSDALYQHTTPVESVTQLYQAGQTAADARLIAGSYTEYTQPNSTSRYLPATVSQLELAQPTAGSTAAPSLPSAGRYVAKQQLLYDPTTANLQQVKRVADVPTVYLWGYANTLPVAQIQNATTAQVNAALSALGLTPTALPTDEQPLRDACRNLRQRLPQARITSFTYRPLVGVTSQTDPSGRTTTYEYDAFNRLLRVRDEQGRILTQQEYKYAPQP